MKLFKVIAIVLDYIGVYFILLDPAVPEIIFFKHHKGVTLIITFIGNPDIDDIGDVILL